MINKNYSLSMWLKKLERLNTKKTVNLTKLKWIAQKLDVLHFKSFIFTVAGTNGKGTTCKMLEQLLLYSGYQVGLYTSPHLFDYKERIRVNGLVLNAEDHISSFQNIELIRQSISLTYFEFITLSALILFKRYLLDFIILEVGLGGRLDATNIINSDVSIITNIGIDHVNVLGKDRESIAREKSGIFRENKIAVIGETNIPNSMNKIALEKKTILKKINIDWFWNKKDNYWNFIHPNVQLYNLPITQIPLSNAALALSSIYYSGIQIDQNIIRKYIATIQLPGRFEIISVSPYVIRDVAHNPDAALYLFNKLDEMHITGKIHAVVGILQDKDILGIINQLKNKIDYWWTSPLKNIRTATKIQLKHAFPIHNTSIFNSIHEAYKTVSMIAKKEDLILIFGSFFAISELFS
ncbi:bifunctional tetrahydrofolate synthase/dihydrofolate synthase [Buchnera aphidicola]|uniref:Dihydrofolate synthase/folylpolyglutamate synthase n=1 Tax=Buchnera aphidicola str. Ua (Uroleucon ambrosiae) TaxID=1005057 RepID=G2LP42_BUCUM|nr:bifunctional tetrahydrofolate synthase/dihydrofolate synthase [Buchnera aphidicola]AEO07979.1 dihydrofolate synthase [Buchnera aphidicola str. Ua (Uroleucon ambrosiae)]